MAEFGVKATELMGASAAGSQPLQPVASPTKHWDNSWMGGMEILAKASVPSANKRIGEVAEEYATGLDKINQASLQGAYNPQEADRERRILWSRVQAQNPDVPKHAMQEIFYKQFKYAKDASGLEQDIDTAKQQRAFEDNMLQEGVKLGMWSTSMKDNPDLRPMLLDQMQTYFDGERQMKVTMEARDRTRKLVEEGRADLKFQQEQEDRAVIKKTEGYVRDTIEGYGKILNPMIDESIARVKSGESNGEDEILRLQQNINAFRAQATASTGHHPPSQAQLNSYLDLMSDMVKQQLDPKNIAEYSKARNQLEIAKATAVMFTNYPKAKTLAAMNGVLGESALTQVWSMDLQGEIIKQIAGIANEGKTSVVTDGKKELQTALFGGLTQTAQALKAGTSSNPAIDAANLESGVKAVLKDMARVQPTDQVKLTQTVNFLAGPAMKTLVEQGKLSAEDMQGANGVYQTLYRQASIQASEQALAQKVTVPLRGGFAGSKEQPMGTVIDFQVDGEGNVLVVPTWKTDTFKNAPAAEMKALEEIKNMNRTLSNLGSAVRIGAHMSGRTDYSRYFEENREIFLRQFTPDQKILDEAKKSGMEYLGGNYRNPANWRKIGKAE